MDLIARGGSYNVLCVTCLPYTEIWLDKEVLLGMGRLRLGGGGGGGGGEGFDAPDKTDEGTPRHVEAAAEGRDAPAKQRH